VPIDHPSLIDKDRIPKRHQLPENMEAGFL